MTQRIIKFRAWDKKQKRMWWNVQDVYDTLAAHCCPVETESCPHDTFTPCSFGSVIEDTEQYTLMQFTGLLDKNGKEIYEGDVIRDNQNYVAKVEYSFSEFLAMAPDKKIKGVSWNLISQGNISEIEIIGNIFETPELLK